MQATLPSNEQERLNALRALDILDTASEPEFDELVKLAAALCGTPISVVTLVDERRQWFKAVVGLSDRETPRDISFCAHAILEPTMFVVEDASKDERFAKNGNVLGDPLIRFYAGMPVHGPDGLPMGTLCVIDRVPRSLTAAQYAALEVLAHQVTNRMELRMQRKQLRNALDEKEATLQQLRATQAELEIANRRLAQVATTDALTGLRNRRWLDERLLEEFELAKREKRPLTVAMLDIDNFKHRNDTFGHPAGDVALRDLASILRATIRQSDFATRYGGEEFAILMPGTDLAQSAILIDRLLLNVRAAQWEDTPLTVSVGVATADPKIDGSATAVVSRADDALYEAKRRGKDQCCFSKPSQQAIETC